MHIVVSRPSLCVIIGRSGVHSPVGERPRICTGSELNLSPGIYGGYQMRLPGFGCRFLWLVLRARGLVDGVICI